jgi:hypothetical protein
MFLVTVQIFVLIFSLIYFAKQILLTNSCLLAMSSTVFM